MKYQLPIDLANNFPPNIKLIKIDMSLTLRNILPKSTKYINLLRCEITHKS